VLVFGTASLAVGIKTLTETAAPSGTTTTTAPPTTTTAKYAQYSNEEYGFSIKHPQNWIEKTGVPGAAVYYNAPPLQLSPTSSWNDPASFNVQIPAPAGGMTLGQLADASKPAIENTYPGIVFTSEKDVQVNGIEGHEWTFVGDNFYGSGPSVTVRQDLFIANDKVYVITFAAMSEYYGNYAGTFDTILNSFTVTTPLTTTTTTTTSYPLATTPPTTTTITTSREVEYEQYSSTEYGLSIRYPRGWTEENASGAAIYCDAPDRNASFNVSIPSPAQGMTLDELAATGKGMIENMFPGITLTGERDVRVGSMEGHEWTAAWENFAGTGIKATMKQDFFIVSDTVYTVTFLARSEYYDSYASTFDTILNSFTVL